MNEGRFPATYRTQSVPAYAGNPFIEALSPRLKLGEAAKMMVSRPAYRSAFRRHPTEDRLNEIEQLRGWFVPLAQHPGLYHDIDRLIRSGYMQRNPLKPAFARAFHEGFEHLLTPSSQSLAPGRTMTIVGESGVSKTQGIEQILSLYPRVIDHTRHDNKPFLLRQIPWVKVDCPTNGSFKSTLLAFFAQVHVLTGEPIPYSRSIEVLLVQMGTVAHRQGLGVLVIDELQNLTHGGDESKILRYLVGLQNSLGVPLILLGHEEIEGMLSDLQSEAQRMSGEGNYRFKPLPEGDHWDYFFKRLLHFQWTRTPTAWTKNLSSLFYGYTQGNPGVTVKLYQAWQRYALQKGGDECLDTDDLPTVWFQDFRYMPLPPALRPTALPDIKEKVGSDMASDPPEKPPVAARVRKPKQLTGLLAMAAKTKQDPMHILDRMGVLKSAAEWFPGDSWPT